MISFLRIKALFVTTVALTTLVACGGDGLTPLWSPPADEAVAPPAPAPAIAPATAAAASLSLDTKTFRFNWSDVSDATHYKLLENPDGMSGFSQVGGDIPQGIQSVDHSVALYARVNASYLLQSCNDVGCSDGDVISVSGNLVEAVGFFKASDTGGGDYIGRAISLSEDGNTLAVGVTGDDSATTGINSTPNDDGSADDSGAVYVFSRSGNTWTQQAYIKASNAGAVDHFGWAISLSDDGNTLAVGSPFESSAATGINSTPNVDGSADMSGAAYIFSRSGSTWSQQAYIKAGNVGPFYNFGATISLTGDGNTLAVGATGEASATTGINSTPNDDGSAARSGAVYVFSRGGITWSQEAYIKASNAEASDHFGASVSLSGDGNTLAAGAEDNSATTGINSTRNDDGSADNSGAVYVFTRSGSTWVQQAYIKASYPDAVDFFGAAAVLSDDGNILAVGVSREDSATSGINSTPNDDGSADDSGAVYVFSRSGSTWSEQAYIKASNSNAGDFFGRRIGLSGDGNTLAVGVTGDDSATTGINSTPNDDGSADNSGAAYVFSRSGNTWSQQTYIKASNVGAGDNFGSSVSLSGDGNTLAIGAYLDDSATTGINSIPNDDGSADDSGAAYLY